MVDIIDVAVIGAGLSGLQAALDVYEAGRSVIILEARDRVGGKTSSMQRPDGRGVQEMGAAWINDTNQSHVWDYCQRFGLTPLVQNIEGSVACEDANGACHFFPFGEMPRFPKHEVGNIVDIRDFVEATCLNPKTFKQPQRATLDSLTFEQWLRDAGAGTHALQTATLWCRGTLGQDPGEISALSFLEVARGGLGIVNLRYDGRDGGQHLRLREGTQSISNGRKWLTLGASKRRDAILRQLGSLFGVGYDVVRSEFIESMTSEWTQDRWAGWGCPFAVTPPGVIGGYDDGQLAVEKCDGLYFVGTELVDEWRGYMEGALRSGKRGAAQALTDLRVE
ncbi:hypothetical protein BBP40_002565 [Aspergillus hancockii]|nr:hypothetical protein BBP40_002565 [Aspergillus hancockii]